MRILAAEDEDITLKHLLYTLKKEGFEAKGVGNGKDALNEIKASKYDILIADIKMPVMGGLELLESVKKSQPDIDVLIITGFGSIESAVEAMSKGAADYITKPFNLDELILKIRKIEEKKSLEKENTALKISLGIGSDIPFIAKSRAMKRIVGLIQSIHASDCNVMISGESGVGKGLVARLIHSTGIRKGKPFLSLNCAVFTEDMLASELFGHERGAFTGAISQKPGLLEIADKGTVFLDEIAEMPTSLQAKLLKVIEEKEFMRVGGIRTITTDVRFIAATNQNLRTVISSGKFREDLYYRLNVMDIHILPLRERKDDIVPLCRHFLEKHSKKANKRILGFSNDSLEVLMSYSFPGNVRELENMVERAVILEQSHYITTESLPQTLRLFQIETIVPGHIKTIDELSRDYVEKVLDFVGQNKSKAAELLGISRTSLWRILKQ